MAKRDQPSEDWRDLLIIKTVADIPEGTGRNELAALLEGRINRTTSLKRMKALVIRGVLISEQVGQREVLTVNDAKARNVQDYWLTQWSQVEGSIERTARLVQQLAGKKGADRGQLIFLQLLEFLERLDSTIFRYMWAAYERKIGFRPLKRFSELEEVEIGIYYSLFRRFMSSARVTREEFEKGFYRLGRFRGAENAYALLRLDKIMKQEPAVKDILATEEEKDRQRPLLGMTPKEIESHFNSLIDAKMPPDT